MGNIIDGSTNIKRTASCFAIKDNKILLIDHKKFGFYLQPGGHIEGNEEPWEAAIREVFEETNIVVGIEEKNKEPFCEEVYDTVLGEQHDYQFIGYYISGEPKCNINEARTCGWFDTDNFGVPVAKDIAKKVLMIKSR